MTIKPRVYQLYYDKEEVVLKLSPIKKVFFNAYVDKYMVDKPQDYIMTYNQNYLFSFSRKALSQRAREIKAEWVKEAETKLEMYRNIKI